MKDERVWKVLRELEELEKRDDDWKKDCGRNHRRRGCCNMILRHSGAKRILEVGTSSGYSTLFLADAARANGGKVVTCELTPFKIQLAKETFAKAGLREDRIERRQHIEAGAVRRAVGFCIPRWDER